MTATQATTGEALLDILCPLHVVISKTGHITHAGPTMKKVFGADRIEGRRFLEVFELKRPKLSPNTVDLLKAQGQRLHLTLRTASQVDMKGVLVALPDDGAIKEAGGAIVNLSFGISVIDAVRDFELSNADFAITDLTVELLYLVEAKSAAMEASRKLNARLQGAKIAAEERAFTDTLTGLCNRRVLEPVVGRLIDIEEDFALMQLDLDYFKSVNDTLGHAAGDHVLREVAAILREETRSTDTIIRIGGDEFVLIFAPIARTDDIAQIGARLIERLEDPILFNGQVCRISGSIGTTLSRDYDSPALDRLMADADLALYEAKSAGRGCQMAFTPDMRQRAESETDRAIVPMVRPATRQDDSTALMSEANERLVPSGSDRYR